MVHYSIDTEPRRAVQFWLATLGLFLAFALPSVVPSIAGRVLVPSAFALYGLLVVAFDRILWRVPLVRGLLEHPDLNGRYTGTIRCDDDERTWCVSVAAVISQTWTKIEVVVESEATISTVTTCGFFIENSSAQKLLYTYAVRERVPVARPQNRYGEGTQELRIRHEETLVLEGSYYSTKRRRGYLALRRCAETSRTGLVGASASPPMISQPDGTGTAVRRL